MAKIMHDDKWTKTIKYDLKMYKGWRVYRLTIWKKSTTGKIIQKSKRSDYFAQKGGESKAAGDIRGLKRKIDAGGQ